MFDPNFTHGFGEFSLDDALLGGLDPALMEWNNIQFPQPGPAYDTDSAQLSTFPSQETSQSPSSTPNSSNPSVESVTTVGEGNVPPGTGPITTADDGVTVCYGIVSPTDTPYPQSRLKLTLTSCTTSTSS